MFKGLPKQVRIGASIYKLVVKPKVYLRKNDDTECYGTTDKSNKIIELTSAYPSYNMTSILIHEICHAIYEEYHLANKSNEESVCSIMGVAWFNLLADNPKLLKYLNNNTKLRMNL